MYAYRRTSHASDDAQLQTDVMRFMAIVAFCLIAVLAVVRNIDAPVEPSEMAQPTLPEPEEAPNERRTVAPPAATAIAPAPKPAAPTEQSTPNEPVTPHEQPPIREVVIRRKPAPETTPRAENAPEPSDEPQPAPETQTEVPDATPTPEREPIPTAPVATAAPEEEGLTLRFASDSDFLRLVARGTVKLYAFSDDEVLALNESFSFSPAAAPGEVHELDARTIPSRLRRALGEPAEHMTWAVGLSRTMRQQIDALVNEHRSGALTIDRFQKVRHVP